MSRSGAPPSASPRPCWTCGSGPRCRAAEDIYYDPDETSKKKDAPVAAEDDDDIRVLPVHFERDGRRFRPLSECEPEYLEEAFEDWPLDGERTLGYAARELRRGDMSWLQHHERWLKFSGVRSNDRSSHEHLALCTAMHHFSTYDQLCIVNSAGCEALNSRRELIEHARKQSPEAPRWEASEDFLGYRTNAKGVIVDPKRTAYVAAKQSQKAKILDATIKAQEARAAWARRGRTNPDGDTGGASGSGAPPAGGGKFKGNKGPPQPTPPASA